MENIVDAIKMAAIVLIFVLALTLTFNIIGKSKVSADSLLTIQDRQKYLEANEVENILYMSDEGIKSNSEDYTSEGHRIVGLDAMISTIYRYDKEKFGVTVIKNNGDIIARFDSATEAIVNNWNNISNKLNDMGDIEKTADEQKEEYIERLVENISVKVSGVDIHINNTDIIETMYGLGDGTIGAPWYVDTYEIIKRINADIQGEQYSYNGKTYEGKNLKLYSRKKIIEITKEIDNSVYLQDGGNITDLLTEYQMPTIEVIYVIYE